MTEIRNLTEADYPGILMLNDAAVEFTSPLDQYALHELVQMSAYRKVATVGSATAAFLLVLREGAPYESDNYRWFAAHFNRFLYVDRIVVGTAFAGKKLGSKLYSGLFEFAKTQRVDTITCEYNIQPPNRASEAFHTRFGFRELDTQWVAGGTKQVSLQSADIAQP